MSDYSANRTGGVDGRRLRSERTRQTIIVAYLGLAYENSPRMPTAAETAERAGYSVRSVFERFPDIHSLQVAATDYALDQAVNLVPPHMAEGDRQTRIGYQVATRGRVWERWLRLWRTLMANHLNSKDLELRIRKARELSIARLEVTYAAELSTLVPEERRQLLIALEAVTDPECWGRMREFFGLSFEEACAAWAQAIDRLLPPTPPA